jgi:hypothetical protein
LGWKLQQGDNELWCQVLWGKYQRGNDRLCVEAKGSDSSLWKAVVRGWDQLMELSYWSVRDGNSVELCNHKWLDKDTRLIDLNLVIPDQFRNAKLKDVVDDNGDWNWCPFERLVTC